MAHSMRISPGMISSYISDHIANVCRPWIGGIADKLKGKPILDIVGGLLDDYEYLWDNYYFSTASL